MPALFPMAPLALPVAMIHRCLISFAGLAYEVCCFLIRPAVFFFLFLLFAVAFLKNTANDVWF